MTGPVTEYDSISSIRLAALLFIPIGLWLTLTLLKSIYHTFCGPLASIPGPRWRGFTSLPHLKAMWTGDEALTVLHLHRQYGPVIRLAPDLVAYRGDSETWKTIYASKSNGVCAFQKDLLFYDKPLNEVSGPISGDDDVSRRMRKTMAPAFSDSAIKQYEPRMQSWCAALIKCLNAHIDEAIPADMVKLFNCTTFDIMSDMLLSQPLHLLQVGDYTPYVRLIFTLLRHVTRLKTLRLYNRALAKPLHLFVMNIPIVRRYAEKHYHFINDRVAERLAQGSKQTDIWSLIEHSQLTKDERDSVANELMIAGTETTATTLSGCLYHLLRNPIWLSALTQDLRSKYSATRPTFAALQDNKLLNAVIKESLRLYPPVPIGFPRFVPPGGIELKGFHLPEGTRVAIYQLATYRDPGLWHQPDTFHPGRWLGDPQFAGDHVAAFEPFSTGPRACSGQNFAYNQMRLLLASVLLEFDLELAPESYDWAANQKTFLVWEKPPLIVNIRRATTFYRV
ncbi:hypothetical protein CERZMDRAFT_114084 [Cercospora zeae-maydis SCOH1-5]|uniref:Cytochrome P450 n=1 Tax=Cercospora zeae-maydis SCOH1-5 TaxID=717836 RepID=A0A6A6F5T7_9PEZI|nr:hypothetical protein CERZMDRAFT_114084 [Cercospora zeae-maydis SCOH1-5]